MLLAWIYPAQHSKYECGSFASATLRLSNDILWWISQEQWESLFLYFGRAIESQTIYTTKESRTPEEGRKVVLSVYLQQQCTIVSTIACFM